MDKLVENLETKILGSVLAAAVHETYQNVLKAMGYLMVYTLLAHKQL